MKKIIAVTAVLNESDIIESYCRYTLSYCDALLIYEGFRSEDNTREILLKLIGEGLPIHLFDDINKKEKKWLLKMALRAIEAYGADLILAPDADEFLCHIDGINPRAELEALDENTEYLIPWRTYVYEEEPPPHPEFLPNRFASYRNPSLDTMSKTVASKTLLVNKGAMHANGKHFLIYPEDMEAPVSVVTHDKLLFAHFPLRSKTQVMLKVLERIPRLVNSYPLPQKYIGVSFHYMRLWKKLVRQGKLETEFIRRQNIEFSVYPEDLARLLPQIGDDRLTIYGPLDTSFCADKLGLRYASNSDSDNQRAQMLIKIAWAFEKRFNRLQAEWQRLNACERELEEIKASREYRFISRLSNALLPLGSRRRNFLKRLLKAGGRS